MEKLKNNDLTVAVVGGSGYVAGALLQRLHRGPGIARVIRIGRSERDDHHLELAEAERFDYAVLDTVDTVVFTAAVSSPDKCAEAFETCWNINVTGTAYFIREALARDCNVLFLSSDAVFGDIPGAVYSELSETDACTPYGRMKKAVEDTFKAAPSFKALRLSYVVSAKDRYVSYCLACMRKKAQAEVFHPFYRNCISLTDVVDIICWLLFHWNAYTPWVLNAAGPELVSRVRIADEIDRITAGKLDYVPCQPGEDFYRNRPRVTEMKSIYLEKYKILNVRTFSEQIQYELRGMINEL